MQVKINLIGADLLYHVILFDLKPFRGNLNRGNLSFETTIFKTYCKVQSAVRVALQRKLIFGKY